MILNPVSIIGLQISFILSALFVCIVYSVMFIHLEMCLQQLVSILWWSDTAESPLSLFKPPNRDLHINCIYWYLVGLLIFFILASFLRSCASFPSLSSVDVSAGFNSNSFCMEDVECQENLSLLQCGCNGFSSVLLIKCHYEFCTINMKGNIAIVWLLSAVGEDDYCWEYL